MSRNWDKENMKVLGVNLKREEAEAFQKLAKDNNTTVGAMLRLHIQESLKQFNGPMPESGVKHLVSYENPDKLKREGACYNPNHRNPDGMLNDILTEYFKFVEKARKRTNPGEKKPNT